MLREAFPRTYADRLRLRFAPLLKLHMENEYPRASVTTRLGRLGGRSLYYGPFPSRTVAEKFANDSLDFFKMRRCVDDLHPDPHFPGCIYSEMKMCLAPCFKGCTDEDYHAEVARVQTYFDSRGDTLVREIGAQRDQASTSLEFENAAALHAKVEKLKPVLAQLPEIVRRIDQLTAIMVQPSAIPEAVAFFVVDAAIITGPLTFSIQAAEHTKSQSMESRIQATLAALPPQHRESCTGNHGASRPAQTLVLSQHPLGRNLLCRPKEWSAPAPPGARHRPRLSRRETRGRSAGYREPGDGSFLSRCAASR